MPKTMICVHLGTPYAPRLCIMDDDHNYWSSEGWTKDPKKAELFVATPEAGERLRELTMSQVPGKVSTFGTNMILEVKSDKPVNLEELKAWLIKNAKLYFDTDAEVMVIVHINWNQLKEISNE